MVDGLTAEHRESSIECKANQLLGWAALLLPQQGVAADEVGLAIGDAELQASFDWRGIGANVGAPVEVALLQTQAIDRVIASVEGAELSAHPGEPLVNIDSIFGRDMELPAELAYVGQPDRQDRRITDEDLTRGHI